SIDRVVDRRIEKVETQVNEIRVSANGKNRNHWGPNEPLPQHSQEGDTWFRPMGNGEEEIYRYNGYMWVFVLSTADTTKNADAIAEQQQEIEDARQVADEAVKRINGETAGKFNDIDTEISLVHQDAQNALNQAGAAVSQVAYFGETLDGFTQTVANIDGRVANIRHDVDGITQTVTDHTGKIATVEQNVHGIQQTVSDPTTGLVTQVSTLANGFNVLAK